MTKIAQQEFDKKFVDKTNEKQLIVNNDGNGDWSDPNNNWDGALKIEGYASAEVVDLTNLSLTSLIIRDCPNLTRVNVEDCQIPIVDLSQTILDSSKNPAPNKITDFTANGNKKLDDVNLKNCKKLESLFINRCGEIGKLEGSEDFAESLRVIQFQETTGLHFSGTNYLERLQETEKAAETILGGKVPMKTENGKQVVDASQLGKDLESKSVSKNIDGTALGLTGADATNIDKIKEKVAELAQQANQAVNNLLNEINNSLNLGLTGGDILKDKVIKKIKELINGPSCTHTDYDAIKAQNEQYKNDAIVKTDVVKSNKEIFGKLGISASEYDSRVGAVSVSASQAEKIGNELIEKRFGELSSQNNTSYYLNIVLSILVIASLAGIIYLLIRENKPKTEPEDEKKEPPKIKKF